MFLACIYWGLRNVVLLFLIFLIFLFFNIWLRIIVFYFLVLNFNFNFIFSIFFFLFPFLLFFLLFLFFSCFFSKSCSKIMLFFFNLNNFSFMNSILVLSFSKFFYRLYFTFFKLLLITLRLYLIVKFNMSAKALLLFTEKPKR